MLLILAGVGIATLTGDNGILVKAQEAKNKWEQAQTEEEGILGNYEDFIENILDNNDTLPIFVDDIEQCTDTSKKYVLPDGYLYEYKLTQVANFTNLSDPSSENWLTNKRFTTASISDADKGIITNYINCKKGDIIRVEGMHLIGVLGTATARIRLYNGDIVVDNGNITNKGIVESGNGSNVDGNITTLVLTEGNSSYVNENLSQTFDRVRLNGKFLEGYTADTVIITVNEEISYSFSSNYTWQRTKLYVPSDWHTEIKNTATTVNALKENNEFGTTQFLLTSDLHFPEQINIKNVGRISAEVMRECNIPFFMNLGDNTPDGFDTDTPDFSSYMNDILDILAPINRKSILATVGNHDGSTGGGYELNNTERAEVYFGWQKSNINKKFGPDGTYYYIDDTTTKTRYIMLNSFWNEWVGDENGFVTNNLNSFYFTPLFGDVQLRWLANEALNMPDGYIAIIGTHGATADYIPQKDLYQFKQIVNAFVNKKDFECSFDGVGGLHAYSFSGDFSDANGELIAIFHGHKHKDEIDTTSYAVPFIGITSASSGARDENAPTRTAGTATETAIDVVTIDKTNRKINLTRLGAGEDRSVNY